MTDHNRSAPQDILQTTRRQLARVAAEFDHTLNAVTDPRRRHQLATSVLEGLQAVLAQAQDNIAKYQHKLVSNEREGEDAGPLD